MVALSTKRQDVPEFLEKMDALLEVPIDDPKALIKALRGVTMASLYISGFAESPKFKSYITNAVDVCTAYVQECIISQNPAVYGPIVRRWVDDVGSAAMRDLSS